MVAFKLTHSVGHRDVKGEDTFDVHLCSRPEHSPETQGMLYFVCDGHGGSKAAKFCAANLHRYLIPLLPIHYPDFSVAKDVSLFSEQLRLALCEAFVHLDNDWMERLNNAGSTLTAVLVTGPLVTVANIGDSSAVLDTGVSMLELTTTHRIHDSAQEAARLKGMGCTVASMGFHLQGPAVGGEPGVGPLRVWPGGLCVSRSIGDADAGPEIVPIPSIKQVIAPSSGCRIIIATDGLWDVLNFSKSVSMARSHPAANAAAELIKLVSREHRVIDDTSIIVLDMLPSSSVTYPEVVEAQRAALGATSTQKKSSSGFFSCFRPEVDVPDSRDILGHGHLPLYAEADGLKAYPSLKESLYRNACVKRSKKKATSSVTPPIRVSEAIDIACSPNAVVVTTVLDESSQGSEKGVLDLSLGYRLSADDESSSP